MKRKIQWILACLGAVLNLGLFSQTAPEFTFTGQYINNYNPLINPTVVFSGVFDDGLSVPINIPPITFGGVVQTSMRVSPNGYIAFGAPTSLSIFTAISTNIAGATGVIAPLSQDLQSDVDSQVSYQITGNNVIVEWKNMRRFGSFETLNFQLFILGDLNIIKFSYGPCLVVEDSYPQVGLKFPSGEFSNRQVTDANTWLTSNAGTLNTHTCRMTLLAPVSFPENGLCYEWNGNVMGCMDAGACNYNLDAVLDDGSCEYCSCNPACGCTDPIACNYDADATMDDGSCYSGLAITSVGQNIFCSDAQLAIPVIVAPSNGPLQYAWSTTNGDVLINDPNDSTFNASLNIPIEIESTEIQISVAVTDVNGCSGSYTFSIWAEPCIFGCFDPEACNFDPLSNTDDGSCDYSCLGCTDSDAVNYDSDATIDNGSCYYLGEGNTCENPILLMCSEGTYSAMTVGVSNDDLTSNADACVGLSNGGQRWYIYNATFDSEVTISTINALTNFDTFLSVFGGSCGNFLCITQNDDVAGAGFQSQVVFDAIAGNTYFIRVGGFNYSQGTFGLTISCGGGCLDPAACNYDVNAPFDDGSCTYGADCYGCTDETATNYSPIAVYDQGCQYAPNIVVFHDLNGDGFRNSGEPGMSNWPVAIPALSATIFTNANGEIDVALPNSTFTINLVNETTNWVSSNASSVSINVPENMTAEFGVIPSTGETFFAAGPYDGFWDIIHCQNGYEAGVFLNNTGAVALNGTLTLTCDAMFLPEEDAYLTIAPDNVGPGFAQWNISDFAAGTNGTFSFHIDGPGTDYIGDTYNFEFVLVLVDADGNEIYNETWTTTPFVACSYDPNDLTANPVGYSEQHFILPNERLEYRVRFQNTGNYPAEDILILDDLDPAVFDLSTFTPLYGSDSFTACLHDDGTIDFIFTDIYLPDSVNDEEGSHGYVVYAIEARADLTPGTVLYNQAHIFFDSNPAVITNETFHTIFDCNSFTPISGNTQVCEGVDVTLDATQNYVENYAWSLNGEVVSNESSLVLTSLPASDYDLSLITSNPLCNETHATTVIVNPIPQINAGEDVAVCQGESITLNGSSSEQIVWSNGLANGEEFIATENLVLTASVMNQFECSANDELSIVVNPLASASLTQTGNTLTADNASQWQWYYNGVALTGETNQTLTTNGGGEYYVEITTNEGCVTTSEVITIVSVEGLENANIRIYPNPMNQSASIMLPNGIHQLTLFDMTGRCVRTINNCQGIVTLQRGNLSSGRYQLQIQSSNELITKELLVD